MHIDVNITMIYYIQNNYTDYTVCYLQLIYLKTGYYFIICITNKINIKTWCIYNRNLHLTYKIIINSTKQTIK